MWSAGDSIISTFIYLFYVSLLLNKVLQFLRWSPSTTMRSCCGNGPGSQSGGYKSLEISPPNDQQGIIEEYPTGHGTAPNIVCIDFRHAVIKQNTF